MADLAQQIGARIRHDPERAREDSDFSLSHDRYLDLAGQRAADYASADPYAHAVIDDFLPPAILRRVLEEFPSPHGSNWRRFDTGEEAKLGNNQLADLGETTRSLLREFNSAGACEFIERLTGIPGIVPDPYYQGGGLHQIARGGFLKVHADFNWHAKLRLHRRVNLLLYLNESWRDEWGGHLELWDPRMEHCVQRVAPLFNRCVVFSTTSTSYHGHPDPLACPENVSRKSLALYYYSGERPQGETRAVHSTLFQRRPGESFASRRLRSGRAVRLAERLFGPAVIDGARRLRARFMGRR